MTCPLPPQKKSLWLITLRVSGFTLISRLLGLVRESLIAALLGTSLGADAFIFAQRIPNLFRRVFAEGAFSDAVIPVLVQAHEQSDGRYFRETVAVLLGTLSGVLLIFTAIGVLCAPWITMALMPGWFFHCGQAAEVSNQFGLAYYLLRITFPYLFFISIAAFSGALLNSLGQFGVMAFTPVLLNLSMIAAAFFFSPYLSEPAVGLAWGLFIGGGVQLLFQIPFIKKNHLLVAPRWGWNHPAVRRVRQLMLPSILGLSVNQLTVFFNGFMASFLPAGAVGAFHYADRLIELPQGLVGVAIATVIFPSLIKATRSGANFSNTLEWGLNLVIFVAIPAAVGLFEFSKEVVCVIYQHGVFSINAVVMTATLLKITSVGLVPYLVSRIFVTAYHSQQEMRVPVRCAIYTFFVNVLLMLSTLLLGYVGLGVASVGATWVNCISLMRHDLFRKMYQRSVEAKQFTHRVVLSGCIMFCLCEGVKFVLINQNDWVRLLVGSVIGGSGYFATLVFLGVKVHHFQLKKAVA